MVNHLNELSAVYMQNIAEQGPEEQQARVTQIVKAVRYRARKEGVELAKAYNDYIGSVQATSTERQAVKEKLGLTGGVAHKEEVEYVGEEEKWIQKAIKKPGALKKQLGVPEDEEIPAGKLKAAAKKGGKLGQRARLAVTLKGLNKEEIEIEESGVGYEAGKPAEKLGAVSGISKSEQEAARERIKAKMAAKKAAKKMNEGHYDPMDDDEFDHDEAEENRGVSGKNNPKGGKALDKKKKVVNKEELSNWREEFIFEVDEPETDTEEKRQIKDKKVNNKVVINPSMKESIEEIGGTIVEMIEEFESDDIIESVYDELIEEGYTEDEVEYGIETALSTLDEGYYDSAVETSKAKSQPAKVSLKDKLKSAAKRAITGTATAAGKAMKAKAAVQAAPGKAKSKVASLASRIKSAAKAGYASGRGPVEKKTTYRNVGAGRKEKIGEDVGIEEGIGMTMAKAMGNPPALSSRMKIKQALIKREIDKNTEKNKMKKYSGKAAQEEVDPKQMQQIQRRQLQLDRKKLQLKQQAARQNQSTASDTMISAESVEHINEMPYQVMGSPDGGKEKKIGKPVKSKKYADARAAELADTHKKTGGQYRSQYVEDVEQVDEKMNLAKADMGDVIKDFYKSDAPQFKGKTKKERQKMAIAAKLTAERGGKRLGE